ncbi:MAG: ABC transporter ATP-binding protein [Candidatus Cloacimonetes bacterium]|nr:ABC transporter ATP-binding protein [Candidatus Cloacimonadota bacterium]
MLAINNIHASYGKRIALNGVSLEVGDAAFVAVIGANGAGKSTLFKAISGAIQYNGSIAFQKKSIDGIEAFRRARMGIVHVPEGRQVFKGLSIEDNLKTAVRSRNAIANWEMNQELIYKLFPKLWQRKNQFAGTLSGGEQQMLALGRGLAAEGQLLLLDEPSMGLAPTVVADIFDAIETIHQTKNVSIMLVEQRATEALSMCEYAYVLRSGVVVAEGNAIELRNASTVREAYLGISSEAK